MGERAPDFCASGIPLGEYCLSDYHGRVVVLAFYPADNSPVCTAQLRSYSLDAARFSDLDAVVLGISPQSVESHLRFADTSDISLTLLSDESRTIASMYDVPGPLGFYRRSIFVIDRSGIVTYVRKATAGLTFSPSSVLLREIKNADKS